VFHVTLLIEEELLLLAADWLVSILLSHAPPFSCNAFIPPLFRDEQAANAQGAAV
jgi:hypothetical protein